jgi:hypothetical protein
MSIIYINPYQFAAAGPTDPDFANVSLLLHGDGTNGSTTIIDSSSSPKTVTAVGNAQISTAQSKFGGASIAFDGNGDYLTAPVDTAFEFGNGDFTVEAFVYINSFAGSNKYCNIACLGRGANGGTGVNLVTCGWFFRVFATGLDFIRYDGSTYSPIERLVAVSTGAWHHVAVSRSGSSLRIFFNGTQVGATATSTLSYDRVAVGGSQDLHIGRLLTGDSTQTPVPGTSYYESFINGYIDDLRITKGVSRYNAAFTPPTAPFPDA